MTLKDKAAMALDMSLDAAAANRGVYTDKARWILACYLDGAKIKASTVRALVKYLGAV